MHAAEAEAEAEAEAAAEAVQNLYKSYASVVMRLTLNGWKASERGLELAMSGVILL